MEMLTAPRRKKKKILVKCNAGPRNSQVLVNWTR